MIKFLFSVSIFGACFSLNAQDQCNQWVDSVFNTMNRKEKVAQLFMIPVSAYSEKEVSEAYAKVKNYGIGGLYIKNGGPISVANTINKLQNISKVPIITGISAGWGLGQNVDSVIQFPKPLLSSTWDNDDSRMEWAKAIAMQLKIMGIQINFAPDLNRETDNNSFLESFGQESRVISNGGRQFLDGMEKENIIGVAKIVLGRSNDTIINEDSELNVVTEVFDRNSGGIMIYHQQLLGQQDNNPQLMEKTQSMVKKKLNLNDLNKSLIHFFEDNNERSKTVESEFWTSFEGNDVIITANKNINRLIKNIISKFRKNKKFKRQIFQSVKKVLRAKYISGLSKESTVSKSNLVTKLNSPSFRALILQLYQESVVISKNENNILPVQSLTENSFVSLSIGANGKNEFSRYLNKYATVSEMSISSIQDSTIVVNKSSDIVFVSIFPSVTELDENLENGIRQLCLKRRVVLVHFGYPRFWNKFQNLAAEIVSFESESIMGSIVPQIIFGALPATANMPRIAKNQEIVQSIKTRTLDRLGFSVPESVGISSDKLEKIKFIMQEAIDSSATPGCQVLVARNGKIIFNHSKGYLNYDNNIPVTDETIYDLASITKVAATLQSIMELVETESLDINKKASQYLPELLATNKKDITIKDILTHQAGLWPYLPFWTQTMDDDILSSEYYSSSSNSDFSLPVSKNLFALKSMEDSLWKWTLNSRMMVKSSRVPYDYTYSDMGFYILHHIVEKLMNVQMEEYLSKNLYGPLGAITTCFQPLKRFSSERIAPTERDSLFRKSLLQGYVHDQGAAMNGGIAGHAGLFSNSNDLAKLGQMWLQKGRYGGKQFFNPQVLDLFSNYQYADSRRGLGWDKPVRLNWGGTTANFASPKTFGHTGFTGTCIWVDPEFDLVFVFLSNRVHPNMYNKTLISRNIRTRIQEIVYQSIFANSSLTHCK